MLLILLQYSQNNHSSNNRAEFLHVMLSSFLLFFDFITRNINKKKTRPVEIEY